MLVVQCCVDGGQGKSLGREQNGGKGFLCHSESSDTTTGEELSLSE